MKNMHPSEEKITDRPIFHLPSRRMAGTRLADPLNGTAQSYPGASSECVFSCLQRNETMSELTDKQLATLLELLDAREQLLESVVLEHIARLRNSSAPEIAPMVGDTADLADIELERHQDNAAVERDVRELRDIKGARARISEGGIGICIDCGDEIGFDRLLVQPTASRCVRCQDLYEHTHVPVPDQADEEE
jgi:DnaK suppressor protein